MERFASDRKKSLEWLRGLSRELDWENSHTQGTLTLKAGDVAASWAAHDLLHLRQLTRRRFQILTARTGSFSTRYAGPW